ncbi:hypothetical protein BVG79_01052 [Ketogulonicigenium robustum]|uniref:Uncharacterized protein n=2 Tax=Ketogulonicigenium robustum TaxID=92947 RepID=A0A1W6NYS0_9RHOB|nr:hypothetical protein BVG79_01052 [Ketogulonicigenium robustum]
MGYVEAVEYIRADIARKVKPLAWTDVSVSVTGVRSQSARTSIGKYYCDDDGWYFSGMKDHWINADSFEAAKAAAQADFEARILSALEGGE